MVSTWEQRVCPSRSPLGILDTRMVARTYRCLINTCWINEQVNVGLRRWYSGPECHDVYLVCSTVSVHWQSPPAPSSPAYRQSLVSYFWECLRLCILTCDQKQVPSRSSAHAISRAPHCPSCGSPFFGRVWSSLLPTGASLEWERWGGLSWSSVHLVSRARASTASAQSLTQPFTNRGSSLLTCSSLGGSKPVHRPGWGSEPLHPSFSYFSIPFSTNKLLPFPSVSVWAKSSPANRLLQTGTCRGRQPPGSPVSRGPGKTTQERALGLGPGVWGQASPLTAL